MIYLFNFNDEIHDSIIETYKTINKSVRRKALWQAINLEVTEKESVKISETTTQQEQQTEHHNKDVEHLEAEQLENHHSKPERIKIERFKF